MHVDNKGFIDGLWRGERKCIDPSAGDADWWIKILKELCLSTSNEILVDVEHVKAHFTKKDKKEVSHFEKFVTESKEKVDELAKAGAMSDGGVHGGNESKDSPAGARRGVCSSAGRSKLSLFGGRVKRL